MKNYEKYAEELREYKGIDICTDFIKPHILEADNCNGVDCRSCAMLQMLWLLEEYEEPKEPEVDWNDVKVDTPILVRDTEDEQWERRYFAKYENKTIYAWDVGRTSWSGDSMTGWACGKLAETEGAE